MSDEKTDQKPKIVLDDRPPVVTQHEIALAGRRLAYTATTGMMPLKDDTGETEAQIFFVAYTLNGPNGGGQRPLTFVFNGGPGSASIWLHMGALGRSVSTSTTMARWLHRRSAWSTTRRPGSPKPTSSSSTRSGLAFRGQPAMT